MNEADRTLTILDAVQFGWDEASRRKFDRDARDSLKRTGILDEDGKYIPYDEELS